MWQLLSRSQNAFPIFPITGEINVAQQKNKNKKLRALISLQLHCEIFLSRVMQIALRRGSPWNVFPHTNTRIPSMYSHSCVTYKWDWVFIIHHRARIKALTRRVTSRARRISQLVFKWDGAESFVLYRLVQIRLVGKALSTNWKRWIRLAPSTHLTHKYSWQFRSHLFFFNWCNFSHLFPVKKR